MPTITPWPEYDPDFEDWENMTDEDWLEFLESITEDGEDGEEYEND